MDTINRLPQSSQRPSKKYFPHIFQLGAIEGLQNASHNTRDWILIAPTWAVTWMDAATMSQRTTPLEFFFAQFARLGFTYNQNRTAHRNFNHLCNIARWREKSAALLEARSFFNDALVQQFNFIYGTASDLAAWRNLCSAIDIVPIPDSIEECQKLVWDAHVNIVDLIEAARTGRPVHKFKTLEELRTYTLEKPDERIFPKRNAYMGGLLKELLREIIGTYYGNRRNGSAKRKARKEKARRRKQQGAAGEGAAGVSQSE